MKKFLLWIIAMLAGWVFFVFAQTPALSRLFGLLDTAIENDRAVADAVLQVLDTYESKADAAKKSLISQIRSHINKKLISLTAVPQVAEKPPVPAGYKVLSDAQIDEALSVIHMQWDASAPIVVMEFLDFQCPYCARQHNDKVLDELRNVEFPGKVRTAAVMFPLTGQRHELATQAAESAECAYIQWGNSVFYAHKAWLYANGLKPTMSIIRTVASNNGLDPVRMQACIDEGIASAPVQAQKNLWRRLGVSGTPWSVILDTRNGAYKTLRGAVPIEIFMDVTTQLLRSE